MPRSLVLILAALCLSGCGMVSSERPLFGQADARGAPVMRSGLWALIEPGCRFNVRSPPAKWPDCAHVIDLRDGVATNAKAEDAGRFEGSTTFLIAADDPAVVQALGPKDGSSRGAYVYFGLRPMAADADGMILRARVWPAMCAPQGAASAARGKAKGPMLLAGLVGGKSPQSNCLARAAAPVRNAVKLSEAGAFQGTPNDTGREIHWIRDR